VSVVQEATKPMSEASFRAVPYYVRWLPIGVVLAVALGLRLYQLGEESLWNDEGFSVRDAQWPPQGANKARFLYYLLLHFWMYLGTSDAWLRGLAVLFGMGCVYLVYVLGYRLLGRSTGLVAASILALSPLEINHSQEIRMYTLATFLGLAGALALVKYLEVPTRRWFFVWAGLRVLMVCSSPLPASLLLADAVLLWGRLRERMPVVYRYGWVLFALVAYVLPSLAYFVKKMLMGSQAWMDYTLPQPNLWGISNKLMSFTAYWPSHEWRSGPDFPSTALAWLYGVYVAVMGALLVYSLLERERLRLRWVAAWGLIPLSALLIFSFFGVRMWMDRYLMFTSPYVALLLAAGGVRLWQQRRAMAIVVGTVYALGVGIALVRYYTVIDRPDYRSAIRTLKAHLQPGDVIAGQANYWVFRHYFGRDTQVIGLRLTYPLDPQHQQVHLSLEDAERSITRLPLFQKRVWLLHVNFGAVGEMETVRAAIRKYFRIRSHYAFEKVSLYLLEPLP
jgi:uncharacterized membrane protein